MSDTNDPPDSAWAPPPAGGGPAPSGWGAAAWGDPQPVMPAPTFPTASAPTPARRGVNKGVLAVVLLLVAGLGVGAYVVFGRDDPNGTLSVEEWASRYCDIAQPYKTDAARLVGEIQTGVAAGVPNASLKKSILSFGTLADDFLSSLLHLANDHPISGDGGAALRDQLRTSISTSRDKLRAAIGQVKPIDPSAPDFVQQTIGVLSGNGLSLDSRMTIPPSPALNTLNVAITATTGCTSLFNAS